jgi:hypothetical protein
MVPAETFDEVFTHLKAYRAGKRRDEHRPRCAARPPASAWRHCWQRWDDRWPAPRWR